MTCSLKNGIGGIGTQRCSNIQCVRQQTCVALAVWLNTFINQFLENGGVYCKTLPHKTEAFVFRKCRCFRILIIHRRNGVNGRSVHSLDQLEKFFPGRLIVSKVFGLRQTTIGCLDGRKVFIIGEIITGTGEKCGYSINGFPLFQDIVFHGQCHKECTSVQVFLFLDKADLPVPHHCPEILFQLLIPLIIPPWRKLRVIDHCTCQRGLSNAAGIHNIFQFLRNHV